MTGIGDSSGADHTEVVTPGSGSSRGERCPVCAVPRVAGDRFCESCRHDYDAHVSGWSAIVIADRQYYDRHAPDGVVFPENRAPRVFRLDTDEIRIGRRSASSGIDPEIDLSAAPTDPGISRLHAALVRSGEGTFALVDLGSTNGTTLNDSSEPLAPNLPVPVGDGDRIHLGAWTTIVISRTSGPSDRATASSERPSGELFSDPCRAPRPVT